MKKLLIILMLLLVGIVNAVTLSYNSTTKIYTITNNDGLPYFVNATSGFQVTNDPNGFWSHNTICIKASMVSGSITSYPIQCFDKLVWTWTNSTDNKTYANLTGTATWGVAKDYAVKITMEYYLNNTDRRIQMTPTITNVGNRSSNVWFVWRVHDIKINNSKLDNWVRIWNGTQQEYRLNDSLNLNFTSLSQKSFYLHEGTDTKWAQTDWDSSAYELDIYNNGTEPNSIIDLTFYQGAMSNTGATSKKTSSKMYWIDAICTWSCYITAPSGTAQIFQGSSTLLEGYWSGVGTCPASRSLAGKFANYTTFYNLANTGNLSKNIVETNPQTTINGADWTADWTVKGNDITNGTAYPIKVVCDTTDSSTRAINVSTPPPFQCAQISTSTTLTSSKTGMCYNITANNVVFDCAGYTISGNYSTNPGFIISGKNNITVKNCVMKWFSSSIFLQNSVNDTFYNLTMYENNRTTTGFKNNSIGFEMINTANISISNTTESNFTINRNGTTNAGGYGYFMYATNTSLLTVKNVTVFNNSGQYHDGDTFYNYGYGFIFWASLNHSIFDSITANTVDYVFVTGYSTGINLSISNITAINIRNGGISIGIPVSISDFNINFSTAGFGISLSVGADWSNVTRYNMTGVNATTGSVTTNDRGISISSTVTNVSVSNIIINLSWIGVYIYQAYDNRFANIIVNNSDWAVFDKGDKNSINNFTFDWSNHTINTQLTNWYMGGNLPTIFSNGTIIQRSKTRWNYYSDGLSTNVYFQNVTANYTNVTIQNGDNYTIQWYGRINVTNGALGEVPTINDTDNQSNLAWNGDYLLSPYFLVNDSYRSYALNIIYNNHYITANASGYNTNYSYFNFSGRDYTANITIYTTLSYSFTISYPSQTLECDFNPTLQTEACTKCVNESIVVPMFLYTNTGSGTNQWNATLDSNPPACMTYYMRKDSNGLCTDGNIITTSITQLYSSIAASATKSVWAYMSFVSCTPQTGTRINNQIGLG